MKRLETKRWTPGASSGGRAHAFRLHQPDGSDYIFAGADATVAGNWVNTIERRLQLTREHASSGAPCPRCVPDSWRKRQEAVAGAAPPSPASTQPAADSAFLADVLDFAMDRAFGRVERARLDGAWRQREGKEVDHEAARKVAMRVVARQSVGAGLRSFLKQ